jgi:hypothetical protein
MWQMRGRRENAWLKTVIAVSAGFLVIVLSLLFYLMRQRRRLTQTKSELSRKNEQVLTLNSEMKQTLTDLDTGQRGLVSGGDRLNEAVANLDESHRVNEKFLGLFLRAVLVLPRPGGLDARIPAFDALRQSGMPTFADR